MKTNWLSLSQIEQIRLLNNCEQQTKLSAYSIEKDWWVSQVLKALCISIYANHIAFKGGTSLSKGWGLIQRFSEDVDISINVDDSTPFRGFKLVLNYNDSIIDFISAEQGSLMISHPVGWWIVVEESSNTVRIECIIFGAGLFVQGPGTILTIHFDGLLEGISYLNFEEYEFYDIMGTPIQEVLAENGKIIIGTPICISIKVFLESAYDAENDTMKVSNNNPLPLISPYDDVMEVESIPQN